MQQRGCGYDNFGCGASPVMHLLGDNGEMQACIDHVGAARAAALIEAEHILTASCAVESTERKWAIFGCSHSLCVPLDYTPEMAPSDRGRR